MGEPITRLNPKIEFRVNRNFIPLSISLLMSTAMLLKPFEHKKRGKKPYDYRILLVLCILRTMQRLSYEDYERNMRTDPRIFIPLGMKILPSKSTIQRAMKFLNFSLIRQFNQKLICCLIKRKLNIIIDSTGIRCIGRSVWYCIRINEEINKKIDEMMNDLDVEVGKMKGEENNEIIEDRLKKIVDLAKKEIDFNDFNPTLEYLEI